MRKTVIIPAEVMENEAYKNLSDGARILFGILTEKKEEAKKNDWIDPQGIRYVAEKLDQDRLVQAKLFCHPFDDRGIRVLTHQNGSRITRYDPQHEKDQKRRAQQYKH